MMAPLEFGETFYWAPGMCNLLGHAAESMADWRCDPELLLCPYGFAWFAQPIPLPGTGLGESLRAIGWSPVYELADGGKIMPVTGAQLPSVDVVLIAYYVQRGAVVLPNAMYALRRGMSITSTEFFPDMDTFDGRSFRKLQLFAAATCLLSQRILMAPHHQAERHARKRLEKDGWTHEPLIRVVELRRKQSRPNHGDEHDAVDWACQWVVSGHWRQQWYPSVQAYQPRWIMPYVKGPEDKPLKPPRAKVFAVVR